MNKVILIGNLTADIDLRYAQSGTAYARTTIALNERSANGETTTFVDCTLFGKTAELANQYLNKGSKVCFEGRLNTEKWQDKDTGANRSKLAVVVDRMEFVGSANNTNRNNAPQSYEPQPQRQTPPPRPAAQKPQMVEPQSYEPVYDEPDSIPF